MLSLDHVRPNVVVLGLAVALVPGCSAGETPPTRPETVVERTVVDGVPTVRNVSGSEWGEIDLEPIAEIGGRDDEEYLFAQPLGIFATADRVLVADVDLGLRAYTRDGEFIRKYGGPGQGPGEYEQVLGAAVLPDGRVVGHSFFRIHFYEPGGRPIEDWSVVPGGGRGYTQQSMPMLVTAEHEIYLLVGWRDESEGGGRRAGLARVGPDGWVGDPVPVDPPDVERVRVDYPCPSGRGDCFIPIDNTPRALWAAGLDLRIVSGTTDRYRFVVQDASGDRFVVERFEDPVAVTADELAYQEARIEAIARRTVPGFEVDTAILPATKQAFDLLVVARDGRILVQRPGAGQWRDEECGPVAEWDPSEDGSTCVEQETFVDIFAPDGRYLGFFERPPRTSLRYAFIDGDEIWAYAVGDDENPRIRGYRMLVPD